MGSCCSEPEEERNTIINLEEAAIGKPEERPVDESASMHIAEEQQQGEPSEEEIAQQAESPEEEAAQKPLYREPKHIFSMTFKKKPLGLELTSDVAGRCAYVTELDRKVSKDIRKNLPLNSKLLMVNGVDVELEHIDYITEMIVKNSKILPMKLTFCRPSGLIDDEVADPNPGTRSP